MKDCLNVSKTFSTLGQKVLWTNFPGEAKALFEFAK